MPGDSDRRQPPASRNSWLSLEIVQEAGDWSSLGETGRCIEAAAAALAGHQCFRGRQPAEACLALSDDASVRRLNGAYRGKNKATNVLSFPAPKDPRIVVPGPAPLGDIVLANETVIAEARDMGIPPLNHLEHLVVHGLLHLLGYDHETDAEAEVMERIETEVLAARGIADPYAGTELEPKAGSAVRMKGARS